MEGKLNKVLNTNSGFLKLRQINSFINGNEEDLPDVLYHVKFYKYFPITSVDVERTFFLLKNIWCSKTVVYFRKMYNYIL